MPLTAVRLSRSLSVAICEEDFSTGSRVLVYAARATSVWRTSSSPSGRSKVWGDSLIDATIARANACRSFAFFFGAVEEPSDLRFLPVMVFLGTSDNVMVLAVVGPWVGEV